MCATRLIVPANLLRPLSHQRQRIRHRPLEWALALSVMAAMMTGCNTGPSDTANDEQSRQQVATNGRNVRTADETFQDLPPVARERIQAQMTAIQYQVNSAKDQDDTLYQAANPANGYGVRFEKDIVRVNSSPRAAQGYDLTMRLSAFGYEGHMQSVTQATIRADGNRLTYVRGGIKEWYVNTPAGVEQGFTLARAPGRQGSGELQFKIAVGGGLTPRMAADGANIDLMDDQGKRKLTYRKLKVTDAKGKVLPAHMKPMVAKDNKDDAVILIAVNDTAAAYPLTVDPVLHAPKLLADDGATGDRFGWSVAISGDTVVVGAINGNSNSGSAYIFYRDEPTADAWGQVTKVTAHNAEALDRFGVSVAISGDTVVVGADGEDDTGESSGAAYIFYRNQDGTDAWGQVTRIAASDPAGIDYFGISVAISGDTVVVGANGDDDNGDQSGSAYIFSRDQGGADTWGQVTKITAEDGTAGDYFGHSVAIAGDTVVVGAYRDDDDGSASGSAYIFSRDQGGTDAWGQVTKITADDGAEDDEFGWSVAIDNDSVVVGAWYDDDNGSEAGAAYLFSRDQGGPEAWGQVAKITAEDGVEGDYIGHSVAIAGDTVVVGAYRDDDNGFNSGSAYLFSRHQGGTNAWGQVAKITANDGADRDNFGISVAIHGDTVAVGAYRDDDNGSDSGSAYIMDGLPGVTIDYTGALTTTEAGGTATFTVVTDSHPYGYALIDLTSSDEGECTVSPAYLLFTSADWNSAQTVTVTGVDDQAEDGDQDCTILMSSVQSDESLYDGVTVPDVTVTNMDDDSAGVLVSPTSGLTTTESGGSANFTVVLATMPAANVTIDLTSGNEDEGTVSPTSLTFTAGDWDNPQTVTVTGVDDSVVDGDQAYTITTGIGVSSDPVYSGMESADVSVTNMDNDSAAVLVSPTSGLTTNEAGGSATFTVVLATLPSADVTFDLTSDNEDEGTVSPTSLTFSTGDWDSPQTVTVTGVDDSVIDGDQAYTITTGVCVSSDPLYDGMDPANVSVTNTDDDSAAVLVSPTSGLTTNETGGGTTFTVVLATLPVGDVTMDLTSDNTDEGTVSPSSLTFTASDWDTPQTVTITGVDDSVEDGDQAYTIAIGICVSNDPLYNGMDPADVSVTNMDDDGTGTTPGGGGGGSGCFIDTLVHQ